MIEVGGAKFLTSASSLVQAPQACCIEIACLGRSNVGKSSFINFFLGQKGLAKSSSTPGKTQLLNFFDFYFLKEGEKIPARIVDLPGFGYAKVSHHLKNQWEKNLVDFLQKRTSIKLFLHLIDSRHLSLKNDEEVKGFLKSFLRGDQQVIEILTKADKLKTQEKLNLLAKNKILISCLPKVQKTTSLQDLRKILFVSALGEEG